MEILAYYEANARDNSIQVMYYFAERTVERTAGCILQHVMSTCSYKNTEKQRQTAKNNNLNRIMVLKID